MFFEITKYNYFVVVFLFLKYLFGFSSPITVKILDKDFQYGWQANVLALGNNCDVKKHHILYMVNEDFLPHCLRGIGKPYMIYWRN